MYTYCINSRFWYIWNFLLKNTLFFINIKYTRRAPYLKEFSGTSPAIQWLKLHTPTAGTVGSIPGQETKISNAAWCRQNIF